MKSRGTKTIKNFSILKCLSPNFTTVTAPSDKENPYQNRFPNHEHPLDAPQFYCGVVTSCLEAIERKNNKQDT